MTEPKIMIIELHHPSDPRYLLMYSLPEEITLKDISGWRYGKPLLFAPGPVDAVYKMDESDVFKPIKT